MNDTDTIKIAVAVDRLTLESRLRDLALIAQTDRADRIGAIATVVSKLPPGAFLIGCGPYTCGILPLTVDEVVLGRPPSPLEAIPDSVPDFTLNDALWMVPREASRIHASIVRETLGTSVRYMVKDQGSRTGTYVNCRRIGVNNSGEVTGDAMELASGDVVTLGPSGVNSYLFVVV